jgi:hypothetical protein
MDIAYLYFGLSKFFHVTSHYISNMAQFNEKKKSTAGAKLKSSFPHSIPKHHPELGVHSVFLAKLDLVPSRCESRRSYNCRVKCRN